MKGGRREQTGNRTAAALRVYGQRLVRKMLQRFEGLSAILTLILVQRHRLADSIIAL
jgi:hypothetical protein